MWGSGSTQRLREPFHHSCHYGFGCCHRAYCSYQPALRMVSRLVAMYPGSPRTIIDRCINFAAQHDGRHLSVILSSSRLPVRRSGVRSRMLLRKRSRQWCIALFHFAVVQHGLWRGLYVDLWWSKWCTTLRQSLAGSRCLPCSQQQRHGLQRMYSGSQRPRAHRNASRLHRHDYRQMYRSLCCRWLLNGRCRVRSRVLLRQLVGKRCLAGFGLWPVLHVLPWQRVSKVRWP